jgi:hypothetical protein
LGEGDLGGEVKSREEDGGWVKKQSFFRIFAPEFIIVLKCVFLPKN